MLEGFLPPELSVSKHTLLSQNENKLYKTVADGWSAQSRS